MLKEIYTYTNYREYLHDFYCFKKEQNAAFSYQVFANKAGFKSKSFIKLVIDGRKNLTKDSALKLNKVLGLSNKPFSYFNSLVEFNQAAAHSLKNFYFEELLRYNKRSALQVLRKQQHAFYSQWYHNTMRELVTVVPFQEDYQFLGRCFTPELTPRQAKESVDLLLQLGLIQKVGPKYIQTNSLVTTGDEVRSLAVKTFHLQNLDLVKSAIQDIPERRDISSLILGLSNEGYRTVKTEIQKFRKKLLSIAQKDEDVSGVYHVNFQLFSTGKKREI